MRAVWWGLKTGSFLALGAGLASAIAALFAGVPLEGPVGFVWGIYLGVLLLVPAALVLRLLDQAEAVGEEGLKVLAEDLSVLSNEGRTPEEVYRQLRAAKAKLYKRLAQIFLVWALLLGAYGGLGVRLTSEMLWVGVVFALLPFGALFLAYSAFKSYLSFKALQNRYPPLKALTPL